MAEQNELDPLVKEKIDKMSRKEMATAWRYAAAGDERFQGANGDYFKQRFDGLGGFNAKLSKEIDHG